MIPLFLVPCLTPVPCHALPLYLRPQSFPVNVCKKKIYLLLSSLVSRCLLMTFCIWCECRGVLCHRWTFKITSCFLCPCPGTLPLFSLPTTSKHSVFMGDSCANQPSLLYIFHSTVAYFVPFHTLFVHLSLYNFYMCHLSGALSR